MSWQPIVVGVDASPEAAAAARFAVAAAQRAATSWQLVYAVPASKRGRYPYTRRDEEMREEILAALENRVPAARDALSVRGGEPAAVLNDAVAAAEAELIVLGGKHHSTLARWLGGSTSVDVARRAVVPLLVTLGEPRIRRVLVAVDQSEAARPTLAAAERYATLFGAELRALSVIERLPVVLDLPQSDTPDYYRLLEEKVTHDIWPLIRRPGVQTTFRYGAALHAIGREAGEWRADLLVVGSHGKGWTKRMLLGSVTERLINHLPTSLLVVPAAAAAVASEAREFSAVSEEET
jgi:nucleotide-binding universal stress UspA family protein